MRKIIGRLAAILALALLSGTVAQAQAVMTSNTASVNLSMTISPTLTISATPANVTFTYNPATGIATASGPITVTTTAQLGNESVGHDIIVFAWLGSTTAALSGGGSNISSSKVFASINGGTAAACTGVVNTSFDGFGVNGAACATVATPNSYVQDMPVTAPGAFVLTDTLLLSLQNLGSGQPVANYTGVISFAANVE